MVHNFMKSRSRDGLAAKGLLQISPQKVIAWDWGRSRLVTGNKLIGRRFHVRNVDVL